MIPLPLLSAGRTMLLFVPAVGVGLLPKHKHSCLMSWIPPRTAYYSGAR